MKGHCSRLVPIDVRPQAVSGEKDHRRSDIGRPGGRVRHLGDGTRDVDCPVQVIARLRPRHASKDNVVHYDLEENAGSDEGGE